MKPCQLCGACSWGPVFVSNEARPRPAYLDGKELDDYRCCDHCGSFAVLALIEERSAPALPPSPGPFDHAMQQMQQVLVASMPKPETRTERMVRSLLTSQAGSMMGASELVEFVRRLEAELDRPPLPEGTSVPPGEGSMGSSGRRVGSYQFHLQFVDRRALETWVQAGLHDTDCPTELEKTLARQFALWVERWPS